MKFFCLSPRFWIKGWIFITSSVSVCICVLSMSVYVYVEHVWSRKFVNKTWMIWEVCEWLRGSPNDLIVCDYECRTSMNDSEQMWTLNKHKWLWTTMNDCERLWVTVSVYEHDMNDYEHWINMNDCEIIERSLWVVCECEQGMICQWEQGVIYEWEQKTIYEWKQGMIYEWVRGTIKSKEQSMNEEWYANDKHLGTICEFFVRLILCISWVTMFPSWLVPTNFKFRPIFPTEVQVHLESNASQLVKKPLNLSPMMKKKNKIMKVCGTFKISGPHIFFG